MRNWEIVKQSSKLSDEEKQERLKKKEQLREANQILKKAITMKLNDLEQFESYQLLLNQKIKQQIHEQNSILSRIKSERQEYEAIIEVIKQIQNCVNLIGSTSFQEINQSLTIIQELKKSIPILLEQTQEDDRLLKSTTQKSAGIQIQIKVLTAQIEVQQKRAKELQIQSNQNEETIKKLEQIRLSKFHQNIEMNNQLQEKKKNRTAHFIPKRF